MLKDIPDTLTRFRRSYQKPPFKLNLHKLLATPHNTLGDELLEVVAVRHLGFEGVAYETRLDNARRGLCLAQLRPSALAGPDALRAPVGQSDMAT